MMVSLLILTLLGTAQVIHGSPYAWMCEPVNQTCLRVLEADASPLPLDLMECKMTCNPDGLLWPIPTTDHQLNPQLVNFFDVSTIRIRSRPELPTVASLLDTFFNDMFLGYLTSMHPDRSRQEAKPDPRQADLVLDIAIDIQVSQEFDYLTHHTDESYSLDILTPTGSTQEINITAATYQGARHALETLSQLISWNSRLQVFQMHRSASIRDQPAYAHRGVSLDTSRNFFPVDVIKTVLSGMAMNKLNTFHWHFSDTQSFPLKLPTVPQLAEYGAYYDDQVYLLEDLVELELHAKLLGIRILPELDTPAHAANGWQFGEIQGLGKLGLCINLRENRCRGGVCGMLNPTNPNLYDVLRDIYSDILNVFPGTTLFHVGGDEVKYDCWRSSEEVQNWFSDQGLEGDDDDMLNLWIQYQKNATRALIQANGGEPIQSVLWSSTLTRRPDSTDDFSPSDYLVQLWWRSDDVINFDYVNRGYNVIVSNEDKLYMDCGLENWAAQLPNHCQTYISWRDMYEFDPRSHYLSFPEGQPQRVNQIVGGEVALWSESVGPQTVLGRLFPRASAFAERMWSSPAPGSVDMFKWEGAETRYIHHRERLVQRGVAADVAQMYWCHQNEGSCRCINDVC